jgi:hypothetical protein
MGRVYWLQRSEALDRLPRWLDILSFALVACGLLAGLILYGWMKAAVGPDPGPELLARLDALLYLLLTGALGLVLLLPIVWPLARALERRIGVSDEAVHLRGEDGREWKIEPSRLTRTRRAVLHGRCSFPLRSQKGKSLYLEGEIETRLEPLLQNTPELTPWQGVRYQWRNRDSLLLWPLASVFMMLLLAGLAAVLQQLAPAA